MDSITTITTDPQAIGYAIIGAASGISIFVLLYLVIELIMDRLQHKPSTPKPQEASAAGSDDNEQEDDEQEEETEDTENINIEEAISILEGEYMNEPQQYQPPYQQPPPPQQAYPPQQPAQQPQQAQNPEPKPRSPELTDAQKLELATQVWTKIAGDTFLVFNVFIKAGFTRSEALELTQMFLTGKALRQ